MRYLTNEKKLNVMNYDDGLLLSWYTPRFPKAIQPSPAEGQGAKVFVDGVQKLL
jgi:hypothetical protein